MSQACRVSFVVTNDQRRATNDYFYGEFKMNTQRIRGRLSEKQKAVINDLFENRLTELEALEKHGIPKYRYRKWLRKGLFTQEINDRIEAAIRQSGLVLSHWLPLASERLAQLTISEKDETARKACLDLITRKPKQKSAFSTAIDEYIHSGLSSLMKINNIKNLRNRSNRD